MPSFKNFVLAGVVGLGVVAPPVTAAPSSLVQRQGYATNGWCTGHITQWQMNSKKYGTDGAYQVDLILYDGNGMFISGFNRGRADGNPGQLKLTALPTPLIMSFGTKDQDKINMEYNGQKWQCPSNQCQMGKYDSGNREGDFGFICNNLPQAPKKKPQKPQKPNPSKKAPKA